MTDRQYKSKFSYLVEKQPTRRYHVLKTKTMPKRIKKDGKPHKIKINMSALHKE